MSELAAETKKEATPCWLVPFENYEIFCPCLVGSYDRIAEELARHINIGYRTFILDIPPGQEELEHINAHNPLSIGRLEVLAALPHQVRVEPGADVSGAERTADVGLRRRLPTCPGVK